MIENPHKYVLKTNSVYFDKYIPENKYREIVAKSDVIINPIRLKNYKFGGLCSGVVESIIWAIPGVYPNGYEIVNELLSSSLFYDDTKELVKTIYQLVVNTDQLKYLKNQALKNSKKFDIKIQEKQLINFIND